MKLGYSEQPLAHVPDTGYLELCIRISFAEDAYHQKKAGLYLLYTYI